MPKFDIVLGDDWMALYKDGFLTVEGVTLTFGDVLEGCRIPCLVQSADPEWAHNRMGYPEKLEEVVMEGMEALDEV